MKRFAIWGTAECGQKVYKLLEDVQEIEIVAFADKDEKKQKSQLYGKRIISPELLLEWAKDEKIDGVVFAFRNLYFKEAAKAFRQCPKLEAYIVPRYVQNFYKEYDSFEKCLVKIELKKPRLKQFDVNLVDHCNMKCKGCLRFSNLVDEPFYADYDQMISDWERIKELFWGVERLKLMGGEPMLSPRLCDYIREARRIFPDADIMVTTNALLINETCTKLFEVMRENYCYFDISLYEPMEKRMHEVERILNENGVWYFINNTKGDFYKVMSDEPKYDADLMYERCAAKNCHHLREGKISVCSRPQYAHIINGLYKTQLPIEDGVWNIYDEEDGWELDRKLSKSFEACKYCAPPVSYEWGRATSKTAKKEDWFVE